MTSATLIVSEINPKALILSVAETSSAPPKLYRYTELPIEKTVP
jgi:hypothetical protein